MAGRHLAFRVHGRFDFPDAPQGSEPIPGTFEFFYVDDSGKWVACVEWSPGQGLSGSDKPTTGELAANPGLCKTGEAFCVRLAQPVATVIQINGAMVLDQYRPKTGGLDLRLLLARDFKLGNTPCHSAVVLGATAGGKTGGEPCFGFVLALPTPGPQGVINGKPHHVFPFRIQFLTNRSPLTDDKSITLVDWVAAGIEGTVSACKWTEAVKTIVTPRELGKFGFCFEDGARTYFQFPRSDPEDEGDKNALWLLDGKGEIYRTGLLERFAVTDPDMKNQVSLGGVDVQSDLSIWIEAQGSETRIVFRSSFRRKNNKELKEGDFIADPGGNPNSFGMVNPFGGSALKSYDSNRNYVDVTLNYKISDEQLEAMLGRSEAEIEGQIEVAIMVKADFNLRNIVNSLRNSLALVEASDPQSLLPDISIVENDARFALVSRVAFRFDLATNRIQWLNRLWTGPSWPKANFGLEPWRIDETRDLETEVNSKSASVIFTLPGLADAQGKFVAQIEVDESAVVPEARSMVRFKFVIDKLPKTQMRLGALEMACEKDASATGHLWFRPGGATGLESIDFSIHDMPLHRVEPTRTDMRRGDRSGRERPLLLKTADEGAAPFILRIHERMSGRDDRRLTARITDVKRQGAAEASYVVLSQQPFSVLQVRSMSLAGRGDSGGNEVAVWDSDTRQWQFKLVGSHFHYRLPPQAVGESMDKPRRLHIVDPPKGADPVRPYPDPELDEKGVPQRHAVEYRLSPPADLWLDPVDVERAYYLPEWESYEIFRQRGELGIGAGLAGFRGEFLYGMPVSIDPTREGGAARGARVAEIESLLGRPPGEVVASAADGRDRRWNRTVRALAHRPERLEFWMREPGSAQPFVPARFAAGVRHALRDSARFRPPLEPSLSPEPSDAWQKRLVEHGLSGGAIWPVEQRAFVTRLLDQPDSTSSTIERVALSPHGGDADQRAEFLNGLIAIISETRGGRIQRQRVEIIGRIGVFWHRAKHVVVYERTTNPSAQFTPDGGIGQRTRRPVARKVEEYVELIEPERRYPDNPRADAASAGFLHALNFNSQRIHVDSEWSEDVDEDGWRIPLWNRASAEQRPSVYPRPDIAFITHAEGEGERPLTAQACLDPDNLYFYSDAAAVTSDTDTWQEVLGVDWINLPPPDAGQQPSLDPANVGNGKRMPSAPRIPRGHRRFTWRLAPPSQRTVLNAGRDGQPLYAGLETLTFSRAGHASDSPVAKAMAEAISKVGDALRPELPDQAIAVQKAEAVFQDAVKGRDPDKIKSAAGELTNALVGLWEDPKLWVEWENLKKLEELAKLPANPGKQCEKLVNDFAASFARRKLLYLAHIRAWAEDGNAVLADLPLDYDDLLEKLIKHAMVALRPTLEGVQQDVGRVEQDFARARGMIGDFDAETARVLADAQRKLAELRLSYDRDKPWSSHRIEEYHNRISEIRDGIAGDIETAASEIRQRLATELGQIGHAIGTALAHVIENAARGRDAIITGLDQGKDIALTVVGDLRSESDRLLGEIAGTLDRAAADAGPDGRLIGDIRTLHEHALGEVKGQFDSLQVDVDNKAVSLEQIVSDAADQVTEVVKKVDTFAAAANSKLDQITHPKLVPHVARVRSAIGALTGLTGSVVDRAAMAAGGVRAGLASADGAAQALLRGLYEQLDAFMLRVVASIEQASEAQQAQLAGVTKIVAGMRETLAAIFMGIEAEIKSGHTGLTDLVSGKFEKFSNLTTQLLTQANAALDALEDLSGEEIEQIVAELKGVLDQFKRTADGFVEQAAQWGAKPDLFVAQLEAQIGGALRQAEAFRGDAFKAVNVAHSNVAAGIATLKSLVSDTKVKQLIETAVIRPAFEEVISPTEYEDIKNDLEKIRACAVEAIDVMTSLFDGIAEFGSDKLKEIELEARGACNKIGSGFDAIRDRIKAEVAALKESIEEKLDLLRPHINNAVKLIELADQLGRDIAKIGSDFTNVRVSAEAYADRVIDSAGNITSGGYASVPNNLLRLYAAAASAPQLPNLDFARDRLGYYYGELQNVIDTTPAEAWFGRLGDELKALGLSLPFSRIGGAIIPDDLSKFDIGKVFRNFGGIDLSNLFRGVRLPKGSGNAVKVTHNFDRTAFRAWVQVDINLPLPGRKQLFAIGPFTLDFVDSLLVATVRLEASKDNSAVEQSGRAALTTTVDAVVSGQSMVALQKLTINFARGGGLKIDLDPRQIKLNPSFKFIQETLGKLFASDEEDGSPLRLVKHNGLPVGIEHVFAIPPFDAMAGTSGVSNIAISNRFSLLAFPDFVIANRFALSGPDRPFIFSIFVLGGTGYLHVDCEYRPFTRDLTVVVEAAAGGSAALGFSLGPVRGSVQITLSIALAFRKRIGQPGGGLTASVVLVIAGRVDVASIASAHITIMLRLAYHENGRIDGVGTLSVSVRVSRFYKFKVRREAKYKLRNGSGGGGGGNRSLVAPASQTPRERAQEILEARG